jgi:hypothetical protein
VQIHCARGFPYFLLVRGPLIILASLAGMMIYDISYEHASLDANWFFWSDGVLLTLLCVSAIAQLIAIPVGLHAMFKANCLQSAAHWLALSCGLLELALLWWLYRQAVYV